MRQNFIAPAFERALLRAVDGSTWRTDLKRRTQHYGWRYDYRARSVDAQGRLGPLPDWLRPLATLLVSAGIFETEPDQAIVNEYLPGQGIARPMWTACRVSETRSRASPWGLPS